MKKSHIIIATFASICLFSSLNLFGQFRLKKLSAEIPIKQLYNINPATNPFLLNFELQMVEDNPWSLVVSPFYNQRTIEQVILDSADRSIHRNEIIVDNGYSFYETKFKGGGLYVAGKKQLNIGNRLGFVQLGFYNLISQTTYLHGIVSTDVQKEPVKFEAVVEYTGDVKYNVIFDAAIGVMFNLGKRLYVEPEMSLSYSPTSILPGSSFRAIRLVGMPRASTSFSLKMGCKFGDVD